MYQILHVNIQDLPKSHLGIFLKKCFKAPPSQFRSTFGNWPWKISQLNKNQKFLEFYSKFYQVLSLKKHPAYIFNTRKQLSWLNMIIYWIAFRNQEYLQTLWPVGGCLRCHCFAQETICICTLTKLNSLKKNKK